MHLRSRISSIVFFFLCSSGLLNAQASGHLSAPSQVRPGHGMGVQLTIYPKGIQGPARYIQEIPPQWHAGPLPVMSGELSVESNQLRITWLNFPLKDSVKVAFELRIPEQEPIGQTFVLPGFLEYLEDGKLQRIPVDPLKVKTVRFYSRFQ